eukprot:UN21399
MYICGKCSFTICISVIFPISMQKTVRPQIRPGKKKLPLAYSRYFSLVFFIHTCVFTHVICSIDLFSVQGATLSQKKGLLYKKQ